ncbi:MAG: NTP transferase domain-containing protein, partial [Pseudomonadota bacterium]
MKTVGLLLAAGQSRRFGASDKLMADVRGRPLIRYAADALLGLHLDERFAVVSSDDVQSALPDFEPVVVDPADNQQSDSLKAGLNAAQDHAADRVLLVLGDMPLVTPQILRDVLALAGFDRASAVTDGARRMPPACFPVSMFPNLLAMQ